MQTEFELIAKTFQGMEDLLARELAEIGAQEIKKGRRVVYFKGDAAMMYAANYRLRTAIRILKPLKHFEAKTADEVYAAVRNYEWKNILDTKTTFAVDAVVYSENFSYSKFVAYKVKDAIVDYFREESGERPNISVVNPDVRFHIHISDDDCTLSLDSSGESLHKRGYRVASVDAPINEVLAAGLVELTGWKADCDFIDPMCGSGTIPIEADMIARNIAPGKYRKEFAFQKWADYSADTFSEVKAAAAAEERDFANHIYAYDIDANAVAATKANVVSAGLDEDFIVERKDFREFKQPAEKAMMVINPPYGVRLKSDSDLPMLYKAIGERLKHQFVGGEAWIICNHEQLFECIGLKPSIKIPLYNGSLDCQFQKYQIFDGKLNDFRREGGDIKTSRERRAMAEPHRFKVDRDFKKPLDGAGASDDDYGDIPDYVVRKHREFVEEERRRERRDSGRGGYSRRDDRGDSGRGGYSRGGYDRRSGGGEGGRGGFSRRDDRGERGGYSRGGYDRRPGGEGGRGGYGHRDERGGSGRGGYSRGGYDRRSGYGDSRGGGYGRRDERDERRGGYHNDRDGRGRGGYDPDRNE